MRNLENVLKYCKKNDMEVQAFIDVPVGDDTRPILRLVVESLGYNICIDLDVDGNQVVTADISEYDKAGLIGTNWMQED